MYIGQPVVGLRTLPMITHLLVAILCLVWGLTWVVIKIGLTDSPPFLSATFRFVIAVAILGAIILWKKKPRLRGAATWWHVLLPGIFMYFLSYASVYYAEQYIPAGLASVTFATMPFFVAVLAHFYLPGERLTAVKLFGLALGFAGIVVIFHNQLTLPDPKVLPAMFAALISPSSAALAVIWLKKYLAEIDEVTATFWQMLVGVALLLPLGLAMENVSDFRWTLTSIGSAAALGIFGSALAFVIYLHLLKTEEATRMSLIAFVTPFVASVAGWIVLGETLTGRTIGGGFLVLAGVYCVLVWAPRRMRHAPVIE